MTRAASSIHLARRHTRETNVRTLGAPNRPVAVPHRGGGTGECLAGRYDGGKEEQGQHGVPLRMGAAPGKPDLRMTFAKAGAKRQKNALLARPQADGVRAGLGASRRRPRIPSQVRRAAKEKARSLAAPAGARVRPSDAALILLRR